MKIIITGSLGNISLPLTQELVKKGHSVTVVSSAAKKQAAIEQLGAKAAIGELEDVDFLIATFKGADAVYSTIVGGNYFDHSFNLDAYYHKLASNYLRAITETGVKRLVHLSSIGAHLPNGNGILSNTYVVEGILNKLAGVKLTFMRPTSFYYNLLGYIHGIKMNGSIETNYGTEAKIPWVSPIDIAAAVAEELTEPTGVKIRYVASEELHGNETAKVLGAAIGLPDLQWKLITDHEALSNLTSIGMNPKIAAGLVEMYGALQTGLLAEDYFNNRPTEMGKVKLADYAKQFAQAYHQK